MLNNWTEIEHGADASACSCDGSRSARPVSGIEVLEEMLSFDE